jgi:hypothetical protein
MKPLSVSERLAEVKLFEAEHDFCRLPGVELTESEKTANLAFVLKILAGYSAPTMRDYAAIMMAPSAADRVRARRESRMAAVDISTGRLAPPTEPEWLQ